MYAGFRSTAKDGGTGQNIGVQKLREFPIRIASKAQQNIIIKLVDDIHSVTGIDSNLIDDTKQTLIGNYMRQIDELVYKLYGFTPEEIAVVERKT